MKKILVIMMMVLMCSTAVMGQANKRTARKPKAKTERAMTEFEKQQKGEYLLYKLIWCEYYYNQGDYESAESYKKDYEEAKNKNYYVEFKNHEFSEKEKRELSKLGIDTSPHTYFYKDGFSVKVYFDHNGKAVLDFNDIWFSLQRKAVSSYNTKRTIEIWKKEGKSLRYSNSPNVEELIDEINEVSGYNVKVSKSKNSVEGFLNKHKTETKKPTAKQDTVQRPNHPFGEKAAANRDFYKSHKSDYTNYNKKQEETTDKTVQSVRYFKMNGEEIQEPKGRNVAVTTYTDGTTSAKTIIN